MRNIVFIHIGKTGGTSIRAFLRAAIKKTRDFEILELDRHSTSKQLQEEFGDVFDNAFKFTVVRNPYTRYASACRQCNVDPNSEDTIDKVISGEGMTGARHHIFVTQVESTHINGKLVVDKVFRFETDLGKVFIDSMSEFGIHWHQLHKLNESSIVQTLEPSTKKFVREYYAEDFKVFGYNPDS